MNEISKQIQKYIFEKFPTSLIVIVSAAMLIGGFVGYQVGNAGIRKECESNPGIEIEAENGESLNLATQNDRSLIIDSKDSAIQLAEGNYTLETEEACVEVAGAVENPGMYCFEGGTVKVAELVKRAGGYRVDSYAARYVSQSVNLARSLYDGEKIYIPFTEDVECKLLELNYSTVVAQGVGGGIDGTKEVTTNSGSVDKNDGTGCIDINSASLEDLDGIDGIGLSTANLIVDNRPYTALDELLDLSGIGEQKYESMIPFLCSISG